MPEYLHPGVYVEEVSSGVRPIEGAGTSTAGFVGRTTKGIPNKATFITGWEQFVRKFGGLSADSFMTYAVSQFFENGGKRCFVVRVLNEASAKLASLAGAIKGRETDGLAGDALSVKAKGKGGWGNDLSVRIENGTSNPTSEFKIVVYYDGSQVELFDDLSMDPTAVNYVETEINDASEFIEVEDEAPYAAADVKATITSSNVPAQPVALTGLNLILEEPDGSRHQIDFAANPATREDLRDRINSEWGQYNIVASIDATNHLVLTHNDSGYDEYFRLDGTGMGDTASGDPLEFPHGGLTLPFVQGAGKATPAVLKSDLATGSPATINITDGQAVTFDLTTTVGANPQISYTFLDATNGGSSNWAPATIASELESEFRSNHNGILKAKVEGDRVVVETANEGRNDTQLVVGGAANAALGFAPSDRSGLQADGQGRSEPAFLLSAEGPFSLVKDANFYIVVNNDDDGAKFTGAERILVKLTDADIKDFQEAEADEVAAAINAATSEDTLINASTHIVASVVNGRVVVSQTQSGPHYTIQVVDGQDSPNIRLKFQGLDQDGFAQGDAGSPYYRPDFNLVSGANEPRSLVSGSDGSPPSDLDFIGNSADKTGLHALDDEDDVNFIAIPGNASATVIGKAVGYCSNRTDCVFIADSPPPNNGTPTEPAKVEDFLQNQIPTKTSYGALYYPWIEVADPIGAGRNPRRFVPPSGFVAGLYARTDTIRGVWKAPAGTEATLNGVLDLEYAVTDSEQDILNPVGVNCVRKFPASGIVLWGARTLGTRSDPEWRYIPIRRYAIYLRVSIYRGTQWAVFEPNDERLWESLSANITDFMMGEFRKGALAGTTPDKAFRVKCDADLNPESEVAAGRVNMEVKFAPLRPAEFVIIRISQKTQRGEG